jgi:hypothetical protein
MSGAAFMRLEKLKGNGIWMKAARHNKRAIQAELGASGHIDANRSHQNVILMGPPIADEVAQLAKNKITTAGITKPRKDAVIGLELVFSLPTNHGQDVIAYFNACAYWAGETFGGLDNIVSADIHRDEAQDHAHVLLVPLIDGRLRGSDAVGNKRKLSELQAKFYKDVASKFGFSKPRARLSGHIKTQTAQQVLDKLRQDPAAKSLVWAVIRDSVARDPLSFALALGIDTEAVRTEKPAKSMAQIFTSKGKGGNKSKLIGIESPLKPYRVSDIENKQVLGLCRVPTSLTSFNQPPAPADHQPTVINYGQLNKPVLPNEVTQHATAPEEKSSAIEQIIRVRDSDFIPENYNPETGEFYRPPPAKPSARQQADRWVSDAVGKLL